MFFGLFYRVGGWKGVVAAIVLGLAFRYILYSYIFHQNIALLLAAQPTVAARHAFHIGLDAGSGTQSADDSVPDDRGLVPDSAWVSYVTTDPDNGARVFDAKLTADPAPGDPITGPVSPSRLELQQEQLQAGRAILTLGAVPAADCAGITAVEARFDAHPARKFAATAMDADGGCAVSVTDVLTFRNAVLNADTLAVTPIAGAARLGTVRWHVAGLTWGGE